MFGSCWSHVGVMFGSCWDHVGVVLGSFLKSCWDHVRVIPSPRRREGQNKATPVLQVQRRATVPHTGRHPHAFCYPTVPDRTLRARFVQSTLLESREPPGQRRHGPPPGISQTSLQGLSKQLFFRIGALGNLGSTGCDSDLAKTWQRHG